MNTMQVAGSYLTRAMVKATLVGGCYINRPRWMLLLVASKVFEAI